MWYAEIPLGNVDGKNYDGENRINIFRFPGILWVSVSGLRELWGGGEDWRHPGEREEDEELKNDEESHKGDSPNTVIWF